MHGNSNIKLKDSNYDGNCKHITSGAGCMKFQATWFLLKSVQQWQRLWLTGTARITTNTVKDTVVLLTMTVTTAWVEEDNRLHHYGWSQAISLISPQTLTNEAQKCSVHKAKAKGHPMFICNATHPFLKIPPFSHSTYSILVHLPTNGNNPFSKGCRLFVSFLKWENWHIQNMWFLYRIHLK